MSYQQLLNPKGFAKENPKKKQVNYGMVIFLSLVEQFDPVDIPARFGDDRRVTCSYPFGIRGACASPPPPSTSLPRHRLSNNHLQIQTIYNIFHPSHTLSCSDTSTLPYHKILVKTLRLTLSRTPASS